MNKSLDPFLKFDEGAVGHDVDHTPRNFSVDRELEIDRVPGIPLLLLEAQRNALAFLVNGKDHNLDLFAHFHDLARMGDSSPAHVRDMKQPVHALKVNEGTEIGDVLDDSAPNFLRPKLVKQLRPLLGSGLLEDFATR